MNKKKYTQAITLWQSALADSQLSPNQKGELLNNIGVAQRLNKQAKNAIATLQQAQEQFALTQDLYHQGQTYGNLGDAYAANKQWSQADDAYNQGLLFLEDASHPDARSAQAQLLRTLSLFQLRRRQWLVAIFTMERSLTTNPRRTLGQTTLWLLLRFATRLINP
ncbi:MAG TPA: hypothetical protein VLL52_04585 [Anaerolineae bacterium]|nr:hypothetical protein [Anaerolineae bacterium]